MTTPTHKADGEVSGTCMTIVKASQIFFGVCVFGNFHIVLATYLHKSLRSKCGLLLAILAFCDLWCLAFELFSAVRLLTHTSTMTRSRCFWSISPYVVIENGETCMLLVVGFDRLMAICFPFKYRVIPTERYIAALIAPGVIYSCSLFILSAIKMNNDMIPVCNLPLAYPEDMSYLWNTLTMVSCVMTLLVYFLTYLPDALQICPENGRFCCLGSDQNPESLGQHIGFKRSFLCGLVAVISGYNFCYKANGI
ncbi:hypothetical protein L596_021586 [Steinernema carpocapsae]|nr:hypothetical protein L596_021586 [Steinernema carpocapsae]